MGLEDRRLSTLCPPLRSYLEVGTHDLDVLPMTADVVDLFLDEEEAAHFLRLSVRTLQEYHRKKKGPPFCRLGPKRIVYDREDLCAWVRQQRVETSDGI